MSVATWMFLIIIAVACATAASTIAYVLRVLVRMFAVRQAVRFLAIDGTRGTISAVSSAIFGYVVRGKVNSS